MSIVDLICNFRMTLIEQSRNVLNDPFGEKCVLACLDKKARLHVKFQGLCTGSLIQVLMKSLQCTLARW